MSDDELEQCLGPRPAEVDPLQRAELLRQSTAQLPRVSRWPWVLGGVLLFACGVGVGWFGKPTEVQVQQLPGNTIIEYETVPVPIVLPSEPPAAPTTYVAIDPNQMEQAAELADPPKSAELYRELGDYYLAQVDLPSATRCYRLHMNQLPPDQLALQSQDSWLLMELKSARRKEQKR